jgi:hypothetical protein
MRLGLVRAKIRVKRSSGLRGLARSVNQSPRAIGRNRMRTTPSAALGSGESRRKSAIARLLASLMRHSKASRSRQAAATGSWSSRVAWSRS